MAILEMTFRGIEKTESIEDLIRKKAAKLEQVCSDLTSCRVAVESPQQHQLAGGPPKMISLSRGLFPLKNI